MARQNLMMVVLLTMLSLHKTAANTHEQFFGPRVSFQSPALRHWGDGAGWRREIRFPHLSIRGGLERKLIYEGSLRKLVPSNSTTSSWRPEWDQVRVVLTKNLLICWRVLDANGTEEHDADIGNVTLSTSEFHAIEGYNSSLIEIRVHANTSADKAEAQAEHVHYLAASSFDERNEWLMAIQQNKILLEEFNTSTSMPANREPQGSYDLVQGSRRVNMGMWRSLSRSCFTLTSRCTTAQKKPAHIRVLPSITQGERDHSTPRVLELDSHTELEEVEGVSVLRDDQTGEVIDVLDTIQHSTLELLEYTQGELKDPSNILENGTVIVEATENHTASVIWLHSIGDSGQFFSDLPESLGVPWCRFIFPTAINRQVTMHNGIYEPAWFDIERIDDKGVVQNNTGLDASTRSILALVQTEIDKGIKPHRIVLAGFGQGGVVALNTAMQSKHRLGGVAALSTWFQATANAKVSPETVGLPVLLCHGNADVFISHKLAKNAKEYLNTLGIQTVFKVYDMMGHAFCPKELLDVHKWLLQIVPRNMSKAELPAWMETVVSKMSIGLMGMKQWRTRSLVLSEGSLQCYTLGKGSLVQSYDLLEHVARAVSGGVKHEYAIELRKQTLLDHEIPNEDENNDNENPTYAFGMERERDEWLRAIGRWQIALLQRHNQGVKKLFTGTRSSSFNLYRKQECLTEGKGPVWENLVFSGGGIKSVVHPAALGVVADCYGDDGRDLRWVKRVAGVSAGSLVAVLVACGCNVDQIQEAAAGINIFKLSEGMSTIQGVRNMLQSYGVYDGTALAELVDELIYKFTGIQYATFQDLYNKHGILLKIFATSVRHGNLQEFSVERTPLDQVAMACRSSMAVPFLFSAVPTTEGDLLVDGGVLDNCPIGTFDEIEGVRNPKTLGFWITMVDEGQPVAPANVKEFAMRMVELIMYVEQYRAQANEINNEVIWIPAPDIPLNTFSLSPDTQRQLFECGSQAAARFLRPYKIWEAKTGKWPTSSLRLAKDVMEKASGWTDSKAASLMRFIAGESSGRGARYDKIKRFVNSWLHRRRFTRLTRDILGPQQQVKTTKKTPAAAPGLPEFNVSRSWSRKFSQVMPCKSDVSAATRAPSTPPERKTVHKTQPDPG